MHMLNPASCVEQEFCFIVHSLYIWIEYQLANAFCQWRPTRFPGSYDFCTTFVFDKFFEPTYLCSCTTAVDTFKNNK